MIALTKEPEVWQNIEDKSIIEKYTVNAQNIAFNLDNQPLSFDYFILEIKSNEEKNVEYIYISFENIVSEKVENMTKFILLDDKYKNILAKDKMVSVVFSLKQDALNKYINPNYLSLEKEHKNLFDLKDENNSIVLLNFKYYDLVAIVE